MSEVAAENTQEVKPKKTRGNTSPKPAAPEGAEKAPRKVGTRGSAKFSMDAKITVLVDKNPKRPESKSFIRFAEYATGMTCKEAIEKGVYLADLYYDSEHKFIEIEGYDAPAPKKAAPKAKAETATAETAQAEAAAA